MNVLHINQSDIGGGAGIAGYRLHQGLLTQGIDSRLLVGTVKTSSDRVMEVPRSKTMRYLEKPLLYCSVHLGLNYIHLVRSFNILKHSLYKNADILNFHNLHNNYFNYLAIPSLTESKPTIYTLHDMWSFTGHCGYSYDCNRWQIGCGKCPYPNTYPSIKIDNTHLEWQLKNWSYGRSNLTIVADSSWLAEQARQSMLSRFPIHHIPYGIDTQVYQPLDAEKCKHVLGIPSHKKVLMFGAVSLEDPRKGGDLLLKVLQSLPASLKAEIVLLIFGEKGEAFIQSIDVSAINLGYISGDHLKSIAYSAADLFLFPTRADAFGIVAQEAAACGTPTVAFNVGGVPDIVRPGVTGYLAQPEDIQDFGNGIMQLLEDNHLRESIGKRCREITLKEYSLEQQAQQYIKLYRQVLGLSCKK